MFAAIGFGSGLAPNRRQTIAKTNDHTLNMTHQPTDPMEQDSLN